jgi:hypothetical protein
LILVQRFCRCGEKLSAKAVDEDDARAKLEAFLAAHVGREMDGTIHEMMKGRDWRKMMRGLREEMRKSVELQAREILEAGRSDPKARRYKLR